MKRFIDSRQQEDGIAGKTVLSACILPEPQSALSLHPEHVCAPLWLTEDAMLRIERLGLREVCSFTFLPVMTLQKEERDYARQLIEVFHRWPQRALTAGEIKGLTTMCATAPATQRKDWLVGISSQMRRPLRELFVAQSTTGNIPAARLMAKLLAQAEWHAKPLPEALGGVPPLVEVCIQPARLSFEITSLPEDTALCALECEQVPDDLRADPDIAAFLAASPRKIFASPSDLNLRWRHDDERVATLDNAVYAVRDDRLVLRRYSGVSDDDQIRRLISVAETHGATIAAPDGDPFQVWTENRETLRDTLLDKCVTRVGYEKHHILRELLQNAESAYASKREKAPEAWFEFSIAAGSSAAWRAVVARHAGRTFNERDHDNHERDDISRIWQLAAASERTPDEIGRFNRGFKSLFTVARDGAVHIRSGGYGFQVIDLLLLRPAQPQETLPHSPSTAFSFEAGLDDTRKMLKLNQAPGPQTPLPVLNASSLVFLRHLEKISVRYDTRTWQWSIRRTAEADGWTRVVIGTEGATEADAFLVFNGAAPAREGERRFAAAIRLDSRNLPCPLEKPWRVFRLTFETEREFCLDFLVNGDFEADQGRVTPQHINRSGLVEKAYEAVLARAESNLRVQPSKDTWLAWAGILHVRDASTELEGSLGNGGVAIIAVATRVREYFVTHIPHADALVPAGTLVFPTQLMRRLGQRFAQAWGIPMEQWIDADIDKVLPELQVPHFSLHGWLSEFSAPAPVLNRIEADLQTFLEGRPGLNAREQDELREARHVLTALLHPPPVDPVAPPLPQIEAWSVENLWHWWQRNGEPVSDYTLDGANWPLLFPDDDTPQGKRVSRLREVLSVTDTDESRRAWYRLFGMACLMAVGRRMSEVRKFWSIELDRRQFWDETSAREFGEGTDRLFAEVVGAPFHDAAASGENAHFWRRIFYDVRKIHQLVWQDDFPATVLELTHAPQAEALLHFMRAGQLPGQRPWAGVFGQSAGSPLFFLIRELRRLRVIENPALDRLAFFACTPVRRAAERIGWLESDLARRNDFESIAEVSARLHSILTSDSQFGSRLLPFYDIPLLHLGLNE